MDKALLENISHELKTPLTVIRAALDQPHLNRTEIAHATRRLQRSIDNLLTAARLDAADLYPRFEWCDPSELTRASVSAVEPEGHKTYVSIPPSLPFISIDPSLFERALAFLLVNEILHSPAETAVELQVAQRANSLTWAVLDYGPQLAFNEEKKVFEKFYRGARSFTDGLLGLWIARELVRALGGKISVQNCPERGVVFTIRLPLEKSMQLPPDIDLERRLF